MTIIDAFGQIFGLLVAIFTSPLFFVILGVLLLAVGIPCFFASFGGYAEGEPGAATIVLLASLAAAALGMALIIWASSSASPFVWIAR